MEQSVLIPILMKDYYNVTKYYRFMTTSIFNSLEKAYLSGSEIALVPESDFIKMTHEMILFYGPENS